jgi:hypothetical protein
MPAAGRPSLAKIGNGFRADLTFFAGLAGWDARIRTSAFRNKIRWCRCLRLRQPSIEMRMFDFSCSELGVLANSASEIQRFESFSIGAGWCQALQTAPVDLVWDVHSQGPRFSSGLELGPSHDGIRRMRRTNLPTRPCRKTYGGRHKDSKRTRLIHRPCRDIAPPVGGIRGFSVVLYYAQLGVRYLSVTTVY